MSKIFGKPGTGRFFGLSKVGFKSVITEIFYEKIQFRVKFQHVIEKMTDPL